MEPKFVLPSPNFDKNNKDTNKSNLHYLTPCGMTLLPRSKQPPPMYGARGSTVPARYLKSEQQQQHSSTNTAISDTPPIYNSPPRPEYCSNCGMELATGQDMKLHLEQHEVCPAEDCDFTALANILERHIEAHHITGLYKTVRRVWTPEDIAAWRAERRKKFPTTANVELAKRAKEQRLMRGERLEASKARFGKSDDRRRTRPQTHDKERPKQNKRQQKRAKKNNKTDEPKQDTTKREESESKPKQENPLAEERERSPSERRMFRGTSQMKDYKHVKKRAVKEVNPLSKMLGMYGTDTEDEEDESSDSEVVDSTPPALTETESQNEQQCEDKQVEEELQLDSVKSPSPEPANSSDDEAPEEVAIERKPEAAAEELLPQCQAEAAEDEALPHCYAEAATDDLEVPTESQADTADQPELEIKTTTKRPAAKKRVFGLNYKRARMMTKQNTMLSKLLESDIRHERNVLLQCVRYVCEQNFFGIGSTSSSTTISFFSSSSKTLDTEDLT